jgi:hypothetical protein
MTNFELPYPEEVPEPGYYYHYKHDLNGPESEAAYELLGVGWHTESGEYNVLYRPLYKGWAYSGRLTYIRPLAMFMDAIDKPEYKGLRFNKITDTDLTERLKAIRDGLYG